MKRMLGVWLNLGILACGVQDPAKPDSGPYVPTAVLTAATWTSIYEDALRPGAPAGCASTVGCHATAADPGVVVSNFVCVDKDACYQSMIGDSHLVRPQDIAAPAGAPLLRELRQNTGAGRMPKSSLFVFQPKDIEKIKEWIANGALND